MSNCTVPVLQPPLVWYNLHRTTKLLRSMYASSLHYHPHIARNATHTLDFGVHCTPVHGTPSTILQVQA